MIGTPILRNTLKYLNEAGYSAYFVGGFVRDYFLGVETTDVDIATDASPKQILIILESHYEMIQQSVYGVSFSLQEFKIEITTMREESNYRNLRHPENVKFVDSLNADSLRRDATVNAIYSDYNGRIFDPLNGIRDLDSRTLRCIGNPLTRFGEDPLRILRFVRLSAEHQLQIEAFTLQGIQKNINKLSLYPIDIYRGEWKKLIISYNYDAIYRTDIPWLGMLIPPFKSQSTDEIKSNFKQFYDYGIPLSYEDKMAVLFYYIREYFDSEHLIKLLNSLGLKYNKARFIIRMYEIIEISTVNRDTIFNIYRNYPIDIIEKSRILMKVLNPIGWTLWDQEMLIIQSLEVPLVIKDLEISGADMMDLGISKVEINSKLLNLLEKIQRNPELNQRDILLEMAKENNL